MSRLTRIVAPLDYDTERAADRVRRRALRTARVMPWARLLATVTGGAFAAALVWLIAEVGR